MKGLFSASNGLSVSMLESHCFNYIHVITSINFNLFVEVGACVIETLVYVSGKLLKGKRWEKVKLCVCVISLVTALICTPAAVV